MLELELELEVRLELELELELDSVALPLLETDSVDAAVLLLHALCTTAPELFAVPRRTVLCEI